MNPAVTLALFLSGNVGIVQAVANIIAQLAGSILAAGFLYGMTPNAGESALGSNSISPGYKDSQAFLGEALMTALLCFTVLMTAVDKDNRLNVANLAPLAIGFSVFLAHAVMIPIDGCSINPARSFGPALVAGQWDSFWVFVVGPIVGSIFAVLLHFLLSYKWESEGAAAEIGVDRTGDAEAVSPNGTSKANKF